MVEIGAEAPGAHFLGQVAVGGCDQAYVDAVLAIGADPLQLPALQHAEQLGLHRQRQLADLVEEQAAAVGQFELAAPFVDRAGEGAAHMAEQFAFHQGLGQRGALRLIIGLPLRMECRWMDCATSSLPTPVSPVISTLRSLLATRRISSSSALRAALWPIISRGRSPAAR